MNRFHEKELRRLGERFADRVGVGGGSGMSSSNARSSGSEGAVELEDEEVELWVWFERLFRHCNRGIKGRGKDRRVQKVNVEMMMREGQRELEMDMERERKSVELPPLRVGEMDGREGECGMETY
jgi:hypothetical protein